MIIARTKRQRRCNHLLPLLLNLCFFAPQIQADDTYYRWLDEKGETIVSDRPPAPGVDYEIVSTRSSFSKAVSGRSTGEEEPEETEESEESQANAQWCKIARENLETLKSSKRVTMRDDNGELTLLSKEERAEQISVTQGQVDVHCE